MILASPQDADVAHMPLKDIPAKHGGDAQESSGDAQTLWEMPTLDTFQKHYYILGLAHSKIPCGASLTHGQSSGQGFVMASSHVIRGITEKPLGCSCSTEEMDSEGR